MGAEAGEAPTEAAATGSSARVPRLLRFAACALTALMLAVTLVAAGFAACASPPATRLLAQATQSAAASPYSAEQLLDLACAARTYAVDPRHDGSRDALTSAELDAAQAACAPGSPTASRWSAPARDVAQEAPLRSVPPGLIAADLASCGAQYALDDDALAHLDDCNRLIGAVAPWLMAAAALAAAGIAALALGRCRRALGTALVAAPLAVLGAFALIGLWGALDFNGLFAAFHGALFPQGNWTFPSDTLLITMYPLDFWVGMAALWLGTTAMMAILSLAAGTGLLRTPRENRDDRPRRPR